MHRRFSSLVRPKSQVVDYLDESVVDDKSTITSTVADTIKEEDLQPPSLKVKRVDHYYSKWYKSWRYRNTSAKATVEVVSVAQSGKDDPWKEFAFVVVRKIPRQELLEPTIKIVLKSPYLIKACKDVIQEWPGVSWNADPLEVDPEMFLTFLDEFVAYHDDLNAKQKKTLHESYVLSTVNLLLTNLNSDYHNTINSIRKLKAHGEITYSLLYAILIPRSIIATHCVITGLPRLFKLISWVRTSVDNIPCYQLNCESIDLIDRPVTQTVGVGKVATVILLNYFRGTVKIEDLDGFPIKYHPDPVGLREMCLERGKKWLGLKGIHHKEFNGIAAVKCDQGKVLRHSVKGRVMIDRATFKRFVPNYKFPVPVFVSENVNAVTPAPPRLQYDEFGNPLPLPPQPVQPGAYANGTLVQTRQNDDEAYEDVELTDEELTLTPTVVYGFSLTDKLWLEFDVTKVTDVEWNDEAFANLVLPDDRKDLLQALVDAHRQELGFDDFIKGKGHGLVINLFGPPGVGKTFSAEATSEHVRRPLYLVGAGDLGTEAAKLDLALERVFELATTWKAIVLIDEADVFLEQRSLHDLERNAMVAVFLRHVEYYRGILFLTTNRVKAFDEAFLSRIHVALHFHELPFESRIQVWTAFIAKVGATNDISAEQLKKLAEREVNGRQIKNAVRTAQSLAVGRKEKLSFKHFMSTLEAMEDFNKQFEKFRQ